MTAFPYNWTDNCEQCINTHPPYGKRISLWAVRQQQEKRIYKKNIATACFCEFDTVLGWKRVGYFYVLSHLSIRF